MREEIKCDICDDSLETRDDYILLEYCSKTDEYVRICTPCEESYEADGRSV
jgi:hypothetical protein